MKAWATLAGLLLCASMASADVCRTAIVNREGTSGADITVANSAITVLAANGQRCRALIFNNATAANTMRCASNVTPTTTVGYLIPGGATLEVYTGVRERWQCIRVTAGSATVSTLEEVP